ncbi:hypothetical protein OAS86_03385, partial [Gammaproteobacteria bacterium]|nr:hypothetical protein [Gammaproteobacteria bacterium]
RHNSALVSHCFVVDKKKFEKFSAKRLTAIGARVKCAPRLTVLPANLKQGRRKQFFKNLRRQAHCVGAFV